MFVCLYGFSRIFTERHLRRPDMQIPFGLLKQGPKRGPCFRAISRLSNHFEGPDFFHHFFTKCSQDICPAWSPHEHAKCAYLGALTPPKGGDLLRGSYLVGGQTRIEPAGAGGASGACFNCDATYLGRGRKVAPQSPLEESATTSARWARKCSASPTAIAPRTPFWSVFFVKTELYVHRPAPKVGPKKVAQTRTDRQTDLD